MWRAGGGQDPEKVERQRRAERERVEEAQRRAEKRRAKVPAGKSRKPVRWFVADRWDSVVVAISLASNAEKMRGALAFAFVGILVALQFIEPVEPESRATASLATAAETLAIAVVAFYFGLHTPAVGRSSDGDAQPRLDEPQP